MKEYVNVALDAMGGDNAPYEIIKGAVTALNKRTDIAIYLTGPEALVKEVLSKFNYDESRLFVVDAPEVITNEEPPVIAIRRKKQSSIVVGLSLVKEGKCDAFVSAGSTGAVLVGAQVIAGRIRGVERTPLAPLIPSVKGNVLLIDCGANVDARPSHMLQFAKMGAIYMEYVCGIKNPKVGILNIGAEEEKGNALVKETFPLLKNCPDINFVGSVEARDVPMGEADVVVCDAFAGNILLKTYEGVGSVLLSEVKKGLMATTISKIGALLIKGSLKKTLKRFQANEYGGAPMLGLKGLVVKTHGNATYQEVANSIYQCITFKEQDISGKIKEKLGE